MKYYEKNEFIKERGSWGPTFKLYEGLGSHFEILRGVLGPRFRIPGF